MPSATPQPDPVEAYRKARELYALYATLDPSIAHALGALLPRMSPVRHSPDYTCILWGRQTFNLTLTQARVVRVLWRAWKRGTPEVHQATLLEASGSECRQLSSLFKRSPAWNSLVIPGESHGCYRLAEPA